MLEFLIIIFIYGIIRGVRDVDKSVQSERSKGLAKDSLISGGDLEKGA